MSRRRRVRKQPAVVLEGRLFAWRSEDGELHRALMGFASGAVICGRRLAALVEVRVEPSEAGLAWCSECWNPSGLRTSVPPRAAGDVVSLPTGQAGSTLVKDLGGAEWEL